MKSVTSGKRPSLCNTPYSTPAVLFPKVQINFTVPNSEVCGSTDVRKARNLMWDLKYLEIEAFGKCSHELLALLPPSVVRHRALPLSCVRLLILIMPSAGVSSALWAL